MDQFFPPDSLRILARSLAMRPHAMPSHSILRSLITAFALALAIGRARGAGPRVHAIVNARIVVAPGQVIPRDNIVMRDGLIVAVGAGVAGPPHARVWEGDSLTVYPRLLDAFVLPTEAAGGAGASTAPPGRAPPAQAGPPPRAPPPPAAAPA